MMLYFFISFISTLYPPIFFFFFFNDTATTEIYTLSLHDALPIYFEGRPRPGPLRLLQAAAARHQVPPRRRLASHRARQHQRLRTARRISDLRREDRPGGARSAATCFRAIEKAPRSRGTLRCRTQKAS